MHHEMRYPGRPYANATSLTNPNFAAWAEAFGARGLTISSEAEIAGTIADAFETAKTRPVVIHVHSSATQMSAWRKRS